MFVIGKKIKAQDKWEFKGSMVVVQGSEFPLKLCIYLPQNKSLIHLSTSHKGFPGGASGKEPAYQCRRFKMGGFNPWVGKIPWRSAWQPTTVCLPEESHGQRFSKCYQKHSPVASVNFRRDLPLSLSVLPSPLFSSIQLVLHDQIYVQHPHYNHLFFKPKSHL